MGIYQIELSVDEEKALLADMTSIQAWIDNAIHNKARQCIDNVVKEYSDLQPQRLSEQAKRAFVRETVVKTAAERQAELDARM